MGFTYKGLKAQLNRHIVTGAEVDMQIEKLRHSNQRIAVIKDRATQLGAEVVLDDAGSTSRTETKTVTASCLRIRSAAGTSNKIVGFLYKGAKVEILETKSVNGTTWGKTAKGWISMEYVK